LELEAGGEETFDAGKGRLKQVLFEHFQEMLPALCQSMPDHSIVVRPHPAESHQPWLAISRDYPNLKIINEDSVTPWLMAAKVLVANGCTTMIEAAVLGTPTVAYQPVTGGQYDDDLPNEVSYRAYSLDELCLQVKEIVNGEKGPMDELERSRILEPHIAALDGRLSCDRMVDVLAEAGYLQDPPPAVPMGKYLRGWLHNRVRTVSKKINMRRAGHRNNFAYHQHRFPGVTVAEIQDRIKRLGDILGRFQDVQVERRSKYIFRIN